MILSVLVAFPLGVFPRGIQPIRPMGFVAKAFVVPTDSIDASLAALLDRADIHLMPPSTVDIDGGPIEELLARLEAMERKGLAVAAMGHFENFVVPTGHAITRIVTCS